MVYTRVLFYMIVFLADAAERSKVLLLFMVLFWSVRQVFSWDHPKNEKDSYTY